jgi:hypothetical protein
LNLTGRFFVSFSDSRDVDVAIQRINRDYKEWELVPLSAEDFARDSRMVSPLPLSFDDSVVVTVYCGTYSTIQPSNVLARIKQFLELAGKVHSIHELQFGIPSDGSRLTTHELAVKYFDSRHAANAVKALNATRTAVRATPTLCDILFFFYGFLKIIWLISFCFSFALIFGPGYLTEFL